ncbi:aromatic ring-hydroxylating dioxygenase subunit alpha [Sphingobium sp. EM0848]|uniref:aromatic ring-hydroxylating dioxygenase subunit alpha n=1 Tax=Sphingobium sp. EM0848 TaxID=2743473 RepID=UPI00159C2554|nr:aromatic ring-hydroxylating dioxygenase subunit alpha [Sphingobium sp. EM0848]
MATRIDHRPPAGDPSSAIPDNSTFLRNSWHAAAWSEEVSDTPFAITVCDEAIILVRQDDGEASALSGICPHRFASLGQGRWLAGQRLQCPYHGLEFDASGRCVGNPHGPVPRVAQLRRYPLVERHSLLWIWLGDEQRADVTLIPDFSLLEHPDHKTIRGRLLTRAHFELITDNLMDLTHVAYIHEGGIGSDAIKDGKHQVLQESTTLFSNRWCPDGIAAPVWSALFNDYRGRVDHWLNMRWDAPSTMWLDVGVAPAGVDRSAGITVFGAHILTPETEISTHYLWAACRDFSLADTTLDTMIRGPIEHAFVNEDRPMIEQVQQNMRGQSFAAMRPLMLASDEGAVRARRLLDDFRSGRKQQQAPVAFPRELPET